MKELPFKIVQKATGPTLQWLRGSRAEALSGADRGAVGQGRWVVLAFPVWSGPDLGVAGRFAEEAQEMPEDLRLGLLPFNNPSQELGQWVVGPLHRRAFWTICDGKIEGSFFTQEAALESLRAPAQARLAG